MTDENLFFKLATRNSQLATRNSQLATAIALSSALLLTACGGSSHSSGDTKSETNKSKPTTTNKTQTKKSKVDKLVGYWKAECDKEKDNSSYREYFQLVKDGKNGLKFNQFVTEEFKTTDCTGKSTVEDENEENDFFSQDDIDRTIFQGNNSFVDKLKDGTKTKYTRIQAKDFPVLKK